MIDRVSTPSNIGARHHLLNRWLESIIDPVRHAWQAPLRAHEEDLGFHFGFSFFFDICVPAHVVLSCCCRVLGPSRKQMEAHRMIHGRRAKVGFTQSWAFPTCHVSNSIVSNPTLLFCLDALLHPMSLLRTHDCCCCCVADHPTPWFVWV